MRRPASLPVGRGAGSGHRDGRGSTALGHEEKSGFKGFRNVSEKKEIAFRDDEESRKILDLVRYANVLKQKPLVADEVLFNCSLPGASPPTDGLDAPAQSR